VIVFSVMLLGIAFIRIHRIVSEGRTPVPSTVGHGFQPSADFFRVMVSGCEPTQTNCLVQIYRRANGEGNPSFELDEIRSFRVEKDSVVYMRRALPSGAYAVKVFQDQDGNGEYSPGERFGSSNDSLMAWTDPLTERSVFDYSGATSGILIELKTP
jgi:uncharacterized protein (DUF2141 family)